MAEEQRRRNLGRGLDALLGERASAPSLPEGGSSGGVSILPIEQIYPGRAQPRMHFAQAEIDELAESIRNLGILQPLIVRPHPTRIGCYEIIAGERRWRAAQQARLHEVPALVRDLDDGEALEIALVENLQRESLSPIEEAEGYRRLMEEFSHTQEALGRMLGKSRSHVANTLRLLNLPPMVREMLADGRLTAGHARALLTAPDATKLAEQIVKRGLSVRQAERSARGTKAPTAKRPRGGAAPASDDTNTRALESEVSSLLGLRVSIGYDDPGGVVSIAYSSLDQLDYLLHRLTLGEHGRPHPRPPTSSERSRAGLDGPAPTSSSSGSPLPHSVEDAIRHLDEGATWDESEPFSFDDEESLDLEDDLDKLIADEQNPFSEKKT